MKLGLCVVLWLGINVGGSVRLRWILLASLRREGNCKILISQGSLEARIPIGKLVVARRFLFVWSMVLCCSFVVWNSLLSCAFVVWSRVLCYVFVV